MPLKINVTRKNAFSMFSISWKWNRKSNYATAQKIILQLNSVRRLWQFNKLLTRCNSVIRKSFKGFLVMLQQGNCQDSFLLCYCSPSSLDMSYHVKNLRRWILMPIYFHCWSVWYPRQRRDFKLQKYPYARNVEVIIGNHIQNDVYSWFQYWSVL